MLFPRVLSGAWPIILVVLAGHGQVGQLADHGLVDVCWLTSCWAWPDWLLEHCFCTDRQHEGQLTPPLPCMACSLSSMLVLVLHESREPLRAGGGLLLVALVALIILAVRKRRAMEESILVRGDAAHPAHMHVSASACVCDQMVVIK